jgi:hypothetical protein
VKGLKMLDRKLGCKEVKQIIRQFFKGVPVLTISKEMGISRQVITNILHRATYKDCYNPLDDFPNMDVYLDAVSEIMQQNRRRAKGRRKKGEQ